MPFPYRHVLKVNWIERKILLGVLSVIDRPRLTLAIAALVLLVSAASAMRWLNVSSDQDKLFSQKVKFFKDYIEFDQQFPENDALYVVIEPKDRKNPPALDRWTKAADAVAARIRNIPQQYVDKVDERIPLDKLGRKGLLFESREHLKQDLADITRFAELARLWGEKNPSFNGIPRVLSQAILGHTPSSHFLAGVNAHLLTMPPDDPDTEAISLLHDIVTSWNATLSNPAAPIEIGTNVPNLAQLAQRIRVTLAITISLTPRIHLQSSSRTRPGICCWCAFIPKLISPTLSAVAEPVAKIREAVKLAATDFSTEFTFGTTGRPALDADEMTTTDRDSTIAEIIAAVAVFIGLVVMLRSLWLAIAAEISLAVGIGWTFGWATLSVGELNLLSIVFLIALIGIGMDYLVQVLTRYRTEARRNLRPKAIWARVFQHVSAPINTACFGAAGAFLVSVLTHFRGAAELGIIAGGGLLLCLLSGYTVLPALLTIFPAKLAVDVARRPTGTPPAPQGMRRLFLPAIWALLIGVLLPFANRAHFDPNLLNLQAPKLESTQLIRKLQTWSSVVLSKDLSMLAKVRAVVEHSAVVDSTESVLNADDNYHWLAEHESELPKIDWSDPIPIGLNDLQELWQKVQAVTDRIESLPRSTSSASREQREQTLQALRIFAQSLVKAPPQETAERLSAWQTVFVAELRGMIGQFHAKPLDLAQVPEELRYHLVSKDGTYALYINPKPDRNLWDRHELAQLCHHR